jgi:hypothetical protein
MLCQIIVTLGAFTYDYHLMLIGRLFFGIGFESLTTAIAALVSTTFKKQSLSLTFGIVFTIS